MRPDERDAAYIWDMLDSARTLHGFVTGLSFYNYSQDKKLQLAVERSLGRRLGAYPKHIDRNILKSLGRIS